MRFCETNTMHFPGTSVTFGITLLMICRMGCTGEIFEDKDHLDAINTSVIPEDTTTILYHKVSIHDLSSLTMGLSHLKQLINLTFCATNTTIIPPGTFEGLQNLTILRLRYNGITELQPGLFRGLHAIQFIDLKGNELDESVLDPHIWIDVNDTLRNLNLEINNFMYLTQNMFINFAGLTDLILFQNRINVIEHGAFNGLNSLQYLHLGSNYISTLDPGIFQGLSSLNILKIYGNNFTVVENGTFVLLSSLEYLSIGPSLHIKRFEPNSLQGLKSLKILSLLLCLELETFEWNVFDAADVNYLGNLFLILSGTSLQCDERLQWMKIGEQQGWLTVRWDAGNNYTICRNMSTSVDLIWETLSLPGNISYNCSPGQFNDIGMLQCVDCEQAFYQDEENELFCKQCPTGYNTTSTGSTQCGILPSTPYPQTTQPSSTTEDTSTTTPSSTTEHTTTTPPSSTTEDPTATIPSNTTEDRTTTSPSSTTEDPTTTPPSRTTEDPTTTIPFSTTENTTTTPPPSTTDDQTATKPSAITDDPTTTVPSSITEDPTTTIPLSTTENTTTTPPSSTTEDPTATIPSSTTEDPTTTIPSSTTEDPTTTMPSSKTEDPTTTSSSNTTAEPTTIPPSSTTKDPTTTSASSTNEDPATTSPSRTAEDQTTTTPSSITKDVTNTALSSTTEDPATTSPSSATKDATTTVKPSPNNEKTTTSSPTVTVTTSPPITTDGSTMTLPPTTADDPSTTPSSKSEATQPSTTPTSITSSQPTKSLEMKTSNTSDGISTVTTFTTPTTTGESTTQVPGCPIGTYYSVGNICIKCPRNTYNNVSDHFLTECIPCPENHETENTASNSSNQCIFSGCPKGKYFLSPSSCMLCPNGTYNNVKGRTLTCILCPEGYSTESAGSIAFSQCKFVIKCPPGYFVKGIQCVSCADGTYQPDSNQYNCTDCPSGRNRTGGPKATSISQCVPHVVKSERHTVTLVNETFHEELNNPSSPRFSELNKSLTELMEKELADTRFVEGFAAKNFSEGSVVATIDFTLLNHSDASCILRQTLNRLDIPEISFNRSCDEDIDFKITSIDPGYGPRKGGYFVTFTGHDLLLYGQFDVEVGATKCRLKSLEANQIVCQMKELENQDLVNVVQEVKVSWFDPDVPDRMTDVSFTFKGDPSVDDVQPNATITEGGVEQTITGMINVTKEPVCVYTVTDGEKSSQYFQVISETACVCTTPKIVEDDGDPKSVDGCEGASLKYHDDFTNVDSKIENTRNIKVHLQMFFDGYDDEEDVQKTFPLEVADPIIHSQIDVQLFVPYAPCSDKFVFIKGERLLQGLSTDVYSVIIGNQLCEDLKVTSNLITCRPPSDEPDENRPRVQVFILDYGGPFDCKQVQYMTGGITGGVLLIAVVVVACYRGRRRIGSFLGNVRIHWQYLTMPQTPGVDDPPIRSPSRREGWAPTRFSWSSFLTASEKRSSAGSRQRERQAESNYYSEEIPGPPSDPIQAPVLASGELSQNVQPGYEGYEIQYHHYEYPVDVNPSVISEDAGECENERNEEQPIYYYERTTFENSQQQPMYDYADGSERSSHRTASYVEVVSNIDGQRYNNYKMVSTHSPNGSMTLFRPGQSGRVDAFHRLSDISNGETADRWNSMASYKRRSTDESNSFPGDWRTIHPEDTGPPPGMDNPGSRTSLISNLRQDPGFMNWGQWRTIKPI